MHKFFFSCIPVTLKVKVTTPKSRGQMHLVLYQIWTKSVYKHLNACQCSGVQSTHCSATKIFGNCDTSRPSLHSSRQQVSIFFFSMHVVMSQFFQVWHLECCKALLLLIPKTFHNNWCLKQHECGLIWVWLTWIDLQIYPSCGASHSESTLQNVRWRHIVLECRAFCCGSAEWKSLFLE